MSHIYITEPNTEGKAIIHTSFGHIDIEFWPQQAPKACRNFIQLSLEKYYDNTIFHRLIKDFMLQGGDPSGTGNGGCSVYHHDEEEMKVKGLSTSDAFVDEFHSRLKFNHRGLLAMANENKRNSNHSQFFLTLGACEFLNGRHTIFGKVTGNTIFNLMTVQDLSVNDQDRPIEDLVVKSVEILWNPFDDMQVRDHVPSNRIEKPMSMQEQQMHKVQERKRKRKKTRNNKLLSFGDEEMEETIVLKEVKSSHDASKNDATLSSQVDDSVQQSIELAKEGNLPVKSKLKKSNDFAEKMKDRIRQKKQNVDAIELPAKGAVETKQKETKSEYEDLKKKLQKSTTRATPVVTGQKAQEFDQAKAFHEMLNPFELKRQKLLKQKKNYGERQKQTLEKLSMFKSTLQKAKQNAKSDVKEAENYAGQVLSDNEQDDDDINDTSWMTTALKFKKHIDDQYRNAYDPTTDDYVTIDSKDEHKTSSKVRHKSRK